MAIKMSAEVARHVEDRFDNLSNEFDITRGQVGTQATWLETGAGSTFGPLLVDGLATFELGWRALLETGSISAGLVAGNTNSFEVDLTAVDQDYGHRYDLSDNQQPTPQQQGNIPL